MELCDGTLKLFDGKDTEYVCLWLQNLNKIIQLEVVKFKDYKIPQSWSKKFFLTTIVVSIYV